MLRRVGGGGGGGRESVCVCVRERERERERGITTSTLLILLLDSPNKVNFIIESSKDLFVPLLYLAHCPHGHWNVSIDTSVNIEKLSTACTVFVEHLP